MRFIFHIGMGKTGTTSIQRTLAENATLLAQQNVHYMGMWFEAANPAFQGLSGFGAFLAQTDADKILCANRFYNHAKRVSGETGAETFILSNESLFQNGHRVEPFLRRLQALGAELQFIAYLRDPRSWLPSAHTQWALRHKTNKGRLEPFDKSARRLIKFYEGIIFWLTHFGAEIDVREIAPDQDVVVDFAQWASLDLSPIHMRALERAEPADTLMRAMFNDTVPETVLPERFNTVVRDTDVSTVPSISDAIKVCFDHSAAGEVINDNAGVFNLIREQTGIDFLGCSEGDTKTLDEAALQRRIIDYLVDITINQSKRLNHLEHLVSELQKE